MTMHMNTNIKGNIYTFVKTIRNSTTIEEGLMQIGKDHGMTAEEAAEVARKIMESVNLYEDRYEEVEEETAAAMRHFFKAISGRSLADRIAIMEHVDFNLNAFSDDKLIKKMEDGVSVHTLFEQAKESMQTENTIRYEQQLAYRLMESAENMNLSPRAIRRMAKKVSRDRMFLANSAIAGREHLIEKCAGSMYLYLENMGMYSPEEAAVHATSYFYINQTAKAVRVGEITEATAEKILACVVLAGVLVLMTYMVMAGINEGLIMAAAIILGIGGIFLADELSDKIAAYASPVILEGMEQVQAGFDRIISFVERKRKAKNEMKETQEYFKEATLDQDTDVDLEEEVFQECYLF